MTQETKNADRLISAIERFKSIVTEPALANFHPHDQSASPFFALQKILEEAGLLQFLRITQLRGEDFQVNAFTAEVLTVDKIKLKKQQTLAAIRMMIANLEADGLPVDLRGSTERIAMANDSMARKNYPIALRNFELALESAEITFARTQSNKASILRHLQARSELGLPACDKCR